MEETSEGRSQEVNVELLKPNVESNSNDEARTEAFSTSYLLTFFSFIIHH